MALGAGGGGRRRRQRLGAAVALGDDLVPGRGGGVGVDAAVEQAGAR
ncbi:MAG: hypothetical protein IPH44_13665 [Myxococcales bacterium]|nr:hypothetical protein [Myxococcales bacterium]